MESPAGPTSARRDYHIATVRQAGQNGRCKRGGDGGAFFDAAAAYPIGHSLQ